MYVITQLYVYLVVGKTLLTKRNIAFSLGRLILLRMMYMNCATGDRVGEKSVRSKINNLIIDSVCYQNNY